MDPNTTGDASDIEGIAPENWMAAIFNEGNSQDADVVLDLITENNIAPYPFENGANPAGGVFADTMYPGGANQAPGLELHDLSTITATTVGATTRLKGGNFPCGLIVLQFEGLEATPLVQIDLVPGTHRGYMCEAMTEM